ncbi:MAG: CxxH/CxxC protein [Caldibacillus sp.]
MGRCFQYLNRSKKEVKGLKYCCAEHVEFALEEMINTYLTPPQLLPLEEEKLSTSACGYCGKPAVYIVANEHSHTRCG